MIRQGKLLDNTKVRTLVLPCTKRLLLPFACVQALELHGV
jgi:hypothetical protein